MVSAVRNIESAGELGVALRQLRKRVMLRVMTRDLQGRASLEEVCEAMTLLAEVSIESAQAILEQQLHAEFGTPIGESGKPQRLIVIGMGKLGGRELNVSSDIDLIFAYPEDGETQGGARQLSNHEFFTRLGRALIKLLADTTEHGYVFRVDMRLRPWGEPGPLAMSFDALENYLVAQGREWERYAWIKARALTGDAKTELEALARPFVFRKYLDYGAIAAMRDLHAQVRAEVARRELAEHVKLGPGGIREIEFIAQAYQLIRGGRDADLRVRPTLKVLDILAGKGIIDPGAQEALTTAYDFLRRVEHRLQYLDDAQTHSLPEDENDRTLIAKSMGFARWEPFLKALDEHRTRVSARFESVFATQEAPRHPLLPLWRDVNENMALFKALNFAAPDEIAARLRALRASPRFAALPESSLARLDNLVPRLIETCGTRPNPDKALERCLNLIEAISRRAAYLALLDEHPQMLARLAQLAGDSPWAAEYLQRHPVVLDELLDARAINAPSNWPAFARQIRKNLGEYVDDQERQLDLLREAHHAQIFRLLARDLGGTLPVEQLADELSDLADAMLEVTLQLAWSQLRHRHRKFPQFAIIGYGKLGGKEMGYASDLDLVFLYDDDHDDAPEVYARLAQRLNQWLTLRTGAGVLFETDLRLRPDGASGLLVSSVDAFRKYQGESAWTWEHQALTRARYCAGEASVGATFENVRRAILGMARDADRLRTDVLDMRRQLLEGHPNHSGLFDVKHDRGGMIDIEFIVQYLVLAHGHRYPLMHANDGNIALLGIAARQGLIDPARARRVQEAYRMLRRQQHALRLAGEKYARVPAESLAPHIESTLELWREVFGAG
jgi:[glutamine synthetase] adenylyltransferase / [glutamine synthetase]-adenylyl-L-tyrosine phosphorylase